MAAKGNIKTIKENLQTSFMLFLSYHHFIAAIQLHHQIC